MKLNFEQLITPHPTEWAYNSYGYGEETENETAIEYHRALIETVKLLSDEQRATIALSLIKKLPFSLIENPSSWLVHSVVIHKGYICDNVIKWTFYFRPCKSCYWRALR